MLKENKIDYFIQVTPNVTTRSDVPLFDYSIFSSLEDVIKESKSCYYPVTLQKVINHIREVDGRYAVTGVPCFIKTLRLLAVDDKLFSFRLRFAIGIVCGGMKSANQAKMIGWQLGVHPDDLISIDFRYKYENKPANKKMYRVQSGKDMKERCKDADLIIGKDYGAGYFKPNACDYCDDVVAETIDISIGDAWLPQYVSDPGGTLVVIVRNRLLLDIIQEYKDKGHIFLDKITKEDVVKSQEGGFRHRREALSYRLTKKKELGQWMSQKRVKEDEFVISKKRKKIYSLREEITKSSHRAFLGALELNKFDHFVNAMRPLEKNI